MSINLKADTGQLMHAAARMDQLAAQYARYYHKLYQSIDTAHGAWKGGDADMFYQQAQGLRDDFQRMHDLLKGAANDLRQSAHKYNQTQSNAKGKASGLATSV